MRVSCNTRPWEIAPSAGERGIGRAADRDKVSLVVEHVDIHDADTLAGPPDMRRGSKRCVDRRAEIVDAEVDGRQRPAQSHYQRIVADGVDHRGDRAAMPLLGVLAALELRPPRHAAG